MQHFQWIHLIFFLVKQWIHLIMSIAQLQNLYSKFSLDQSFYFILFF